MLYSLQRRFPIFLLYLLASTAALGDQDYPPEVKPIIEQRCMVCHGCYDAPCQLKLDAWVGLQRGASKEKVYDGTRLRTANLTRLFEDCAADAACAGVARSRRRSVIRRRWRWRPTARAATRSWCFARW